jgi:heme/copper-type cytochrome/quinol oxidase subunit 3
MDSQMTIVLLASGMMLTIAASLGDRARRRAPLAWHAYVPWHAALFGGVAAVLFAAGHLYSLVKLAAP